MFNSLRLSVVVTTEVLADIAADVTADITAEAIASRLGYCSGGLDTNWNCLLKNIGWFLVSIVNI